MTTETKAPITWEDFERIDIRCGTIVEAREFPGARKPAYQLVIDFGPLGMRKSSAQITAHYDIARLTGVQVLAVVNFPPKQIGPFMSECLVLGVYDEHGDVVLLQPGHRVADGRPVG